MLCRGIYNGAEFVREEGAFDVPFSGEEAAGPGRGRFWLPGICACRDPEREGYGKKTF